MPTRGTKLSTLDHIEYIPLGGPITHRVKCWYVTNVLLINADSSHVNKSGFFVTVMRGNQTKCLSQGPFCIRTEIFFSCFHITVLIITGCHLSSPSMVPGVLPLWMKRPEC